MAAMNKLLSLFSGVAGLVVAGAVALLIFTLVGGLLIAAGVLVAGLALAGGIYALVTGRRAFTVQRFYFEDVSARRSGFPDEREMIDVTPPKVRKGAPAGDARPTVPPGA